MHTIIRIFGAACLGIALMGASCDFVDNPTGGGTGGGGTTEDPVYSMGAGSGASHQPGALDIAVTNLSAGGSTSVSVSIVDQNGTPYTVSTEVSFVSSCVSQSLATMPTPITATAGTASTTYTAQGCSGTDTITATAVVDSQTLSATGTVTVAPSTVGSIQFISATPETIGLKGTGGAGIQETSIIVFKVVNASGGPVPDQNVTFTLGSTVGGVTLSPSTALSGSDGTVQTIVNSGTIATTVRVTATATGITPTISTQSSNLTISTAIVDDNSFVVAPTCPNIEAFSIEGVEVDITAFASDRFGNPVPDGTSVSFTSEPGGSVESNCITLAGACSVTWRSQGAGAETPDTLGRSGRVSVLATVIGEESFIDSNGNGVFDSGDVFTDVEEPFRDDDESGVFDIGVDGFFLDFNSNSTHDAANGDFDGVLCTHPTLCGAATLGLGEEMLIIKATGGAVITPTPAGAIALPATVAFLIADGNGNPMPAGTTIEVEAGNGEIIGPTSFDYGCTTEPAIYSFSLTADTTPSSGNLVLTVTSPGGIISVSSVTITD